MMSPMVNRMDQAANNIINPTTPGPMTPMTPSSADPGLMPQLQYVQYTFLRSHFKDLGSPNPAGGLHLMICKVKRSKT